MNIDPLAEKYHPISPYVYTLNNPIIYTDPDGKDVILRLKGERLRGYQKFVSTRVGRAFVSQFLKKGDKIPGTNISIKESGKYSNETLSFKLAKVRKGKAAIFYKNKDGTRGLYIRKVRSQKDLKDTNSNYELTVYLEKSDKIKADEYAVIVGHESFVHLSNKLEKIDKIRNKANSNKYRSVNEYLLDVMGLGKGAKDEHKKLSRDQINSFIEMIRELDKKEKTTKYTKMYNENKKSND